MVRVVATILILLSGWASINAQTLDLGSDTTICGEETTLDAGPGFTFYQWQDGTTDRFLDIDTTGQYWVEVQDTAGNTLRDTLMVTFYPQPAVDFYYIGNCSSNPFQFVNTTISDDTIFNWLWDFGDGTTDTSFETNHAFTMGGNYPITLIGETINGCADTITKPGLVAQAPVFDAGNDTTINVGASAQLMADTIAGDYQWSPSQTLDDDTLIRPTATPGITTTYFLEVTGANFCTGTDSVTVFVNQPPVANDDIANLGTNSTRIIKVQNNDSDPENATLITTVVDSPTHGTVTVLNNDSLSYTSPQDYNGPDTLTYQICDDGNPALCDQAMVFLFINNSPPVAIDDTLIIETDETATVDVLDNDSDPNGQDISVFVVSAAQNGESTNLGGGLVEYTAGATYSGTDSFYYIICDDGSPLLCDTAWVRVGVEAVAFNIPNSFSPNGDGLLDAFVIEGLQNYPGNKLTIFSRWGDVVLEQKNYNNNWNGKRDFEEELPEGTYFYVLDLNNGSEPLTGYIMLQR